MVLIMNVTWPPILQSNDMNWLVLYYINISSYIEVLHYSMAVLESNFACSATSSTQVKASTRYLALKTQPFYWEVYQVGMVYLFQRSYESFLSYLHSALLDFVVIIFIHKCSEGKMKPTFCCSKSDVHIRSVCCVLWKIIIWYTFQRPGDPLFPWGYRWGWPIGNNG